MAGFALGILAGGNGSRLGGRDKGWIEHEGRAQILRVLDALGLSPAQVMISANRNLDSYAALGARVLPDRWPGCPGPFAGVATLLAELRHDVLITLPVDVNAVPHDLVQRMRAVETDDLRDVVLALDDDGMQPLIARYSCVLAAHALESFDAGGRSVREWQHRFPVHPCDFRGWRFGNLNTPQDLQSQ